MVTAEHDQRVARFNGPARGTSQHLIGGTNAARKVHIHERLVLLDVAEIEVTEVVDRVVWEEAATGVLRLELQVSVEVRNGQRHFFFLLSFLYPCLEWKKNHRVQQDLRCN